jgi:hypothetical protein
VSASHRARIRWLSPDEGGRPQPPTGEQYVTVARFEDPAGDWSTNAWSVVLSFEGSPEEADVSFLVPEAPPHLLQSGAVFELYEGSKKVAKVSVV